MKKDWTYKKLGEVTKIKTGKLDANASSEDGIYPFFTCSKEPLRISSYSYDCECVLVAGNGDLNVKYYKGKFDAYQRTYIIATTPDSGVMTYYMYHFFNKYIETLRQKSIGGIIKYIKLGDLTEATIPVPPISIQESIVRELDAIHGILEKKQEQLRELDNLAQAIFYEMFGDPITNPKQWEVKKLGEVCDVRDGTHDSPKYLPSSEYILITSKNIVNGEIDFSVSNYINREDFEAINRRSRVDVGDIIMPMIGTIGNPIIIKPTEKKFCIKNVALIKFANAEEVINVYIRELLDSPSYIGFLKSINQGGTQKFIALGTIRKLSIPLPPLSLQQSFAAKIEAIEAQKQAVQQSIREVETLLAERMDNYFN